MSSRDVIACLRGLREQIGAAVEAMPADSWTANVFDDGWNERQLVYHMASTSGVASFVLAMSKLPAQTSGEPFDNDAFNRDQVALREGWPPADALGEIRSNIQRDIRRSSKRRTKTCSAVDGAVGNHRHRRRDHHSRGGWPSRRAPRRSSQRRWLSYQSTQALPERSSCTPRSYFS